MPLLRPLGLPDRILTVVGGVLIGLLLFSAVTGFAALVFKKTSQQSVGVVRFGYGAMGAVFGAFFGLLNVWVFFLVIRLLGTIAQNGIEKQAARAPRFPVHSAQPAWMHGLVEVKKTFDEGATGRIAGRLDPVPEQV
ncbi:MAG: hypothetical protein V4710_06260, partial [Verrucomicrobiota bacterium]